MVMGEDWARAGRSVAWGARALVKMVVGMNASGELVEMELLAEDGVQSLGYPPSDPPGKSVL